MTTSNANVQTETTLVIRASLPLAGTCAVCGASAEPRPHFSAYVIHTWQPVCNGCTRRINPALADIMDGYERRNPQ